MSNVAFLPPGLRLKKIVREPEWVEIARARPDGPVWRVKLAFMSYRTFREAVGEAQALRARATGDAEEAEMTAMMPMFEKVALDWEGATIQNINAVLRGERAIRPQDESPEAMAEFVETYFTKQQPLPFTHAFFAHIWFNSYPDRFQNVIFGKLQSWGDNIEAEVAKGKND